MEQVKIQPASNSERMPNWFLYVVIILCIAPFTLNMLGISFGISGAKLDLVAAQSYSPLQLLDAHFHRLSGAFSHTLLEWSAFCAAIFTVCLAFSHYVLTKDLTTPVIGSALFLAGCMDAFHTLAADRLIEAVADNSDLVPFTWAICRLFNAIILILGVVILLYRKPASPKANIRFLVVAGLFFAAIAYLIINYAANAAVLPQTQYPDALVTRPYDVVPLIFYLFAGLYLFPKFYKKHPSVFAHALIIAMIPETIVELHMAFGSSALFDNHFNIAHFLKILAYVIPFAGLLMDYIHTYRSKEREIAVREHAEIALRENMAELEETNRELDKFAYVASHDLKAPLRGIEHLATWITEDIDDPDATAGHLSMMTQRIKRMEKLLDDLLSYSRIGRQRMVARSVDTGDLVQVLFDMATPPEGFHLRVAGNMPVFLTMEAPFELVIRNLINNAVKHHDKTDGTITVSSTDAGDFYEFRIQDDGPGIAEEFHEKIFEVFQTLKPRDEMEGSGVGLALVKKTVHVYGGAITVKSALGEGTRFYVKWPKNIEQSGELDDGGLEVNKLTA